MEVMFGVRHELNAAFSIAKRGTAHSKSGNAQVLWIPDPTRITVRRKKLAQIKGQDRVRDTIKHAHELNLEKCFL